MNSVIKLPSTDEVSFAVLDVNFELLVGHVKSDLSFVVVQVEFSRVKLPGSYVLVVALLLGLVLPFEFAASVRSPFDLSFRLAFVVAVAVVLCVDPGLACGVLSLHVDAGVVLVSGYVDSDFDFLVIDINLNFGVNVFFALPL